MRISTFAAVAILGASLTSNALAIDFPSQEDIEHIATTGIEYQQKLQDISQNKKTFANMQDVAGFLHKYNKTQMDLDFYKNWGRFCLKDANEEKNLLNALNNSIESQNFRSTQASLTKIIGTFDRDVMDAHNWSETHKGKEHTFYDVDPTLSAEKFFALKAQYGNDFDGFWKAVSKQNNNVSNDINFDANIKDLQNKVITAKDNFDKNTKPYKDYENSYNTFAKELIGSFSSLQPIIKGQEEVIKKGFDGLDINARINETSFQQYKNFLLAYAEINLNLRDKKIMDGVKTSFGNVLDKQIAETTKFINSLSDKDFKDFYVVSNPSLEFIKQMKNKGSISQFINFERLEGLVSNMNQNASKQEVINNLNTIKDALINELDVNNFIDEDKDIEELKQEIKELKEATLASFKKEIQEENPSLGDNLTFKDILTDPDGEQDADESQSIRELAETMRALLALSKLNADDFNFDFKIPENAAQNRAIEELKQAILQRLDGEQKAAFERIDFSKQENLNKLLGSDEDFNELLAKEIKEPSINPNPDIDNKPKPDIKPGHDYNSQINDIAKNKQTFTCIKKVAQFLNTYKNSNVNVEEYFKYVKLINALYPNSGSSEGGWLDELNEKILAGDKEGIDEILKIIEAKLQKFKAIMDKERALQAQGKRSVFDYKDGIKPEELTQLNKDLEDKNKEIAKEKDPVKLAKLLQEKHAIESKLYKDGVVSDLDNKAESLDIQKEVVNSETASEEDKKAAKEEIEKLEKEIEKEISKKVKKEAKSQAHEAIADEIFAIAKFSSANGSAQENIEKQLKIVDAVAKSINETSSISNAFSAINALKLSSTMQISTRLAMNSNPYKEDISLAKAITELSKDKFASNDNLALSKTISAYTDRFNHNNNAWINIIGSKGDVKDAFDTSLYGFTMGYDYAFSDSIVGVFANYAKGKTQTDDKNIENKTNNYQLGIYARKYLGAHELDAQFTYGLSKNDLENNIPLLSAYNTADYNSNIFDFKLGYGYVFDLNNDFFIKPNISASYSIVKDDEYTETGSLYAKKVSDKTNKMLSSTFGVEFRKYLENGSYFYITPGVERELYKNFDDTKFSFVNGSGKVLSIKADEDKQTYGVINAGADFKLTDSLKLNIDLGGKFKSEEKYYNGNIGLKYAF